MILNPIYRVTTYVPANAAEKVRAAITAVLPSVFGNYSGVLWISGQGIEQFRPELNSLPAHGVEGELTETAAVEIKFSLPRDEALLQEVIERGIFQSHPWEVPVITVEAAFAALKPEIG